MDCNRSFWQKLNDSNLLELFESLECWTIEDSFWEMVENVSAYKQISNTAFNFLISSRKVNIRAILYNEKTVQKFATELRNFLLLYEETAELLLAQYVENTIESGNTCISQKLKFKDKEDIISRYLDSENPI